jgi:hypothetical protein
MGGGGHKWQGCTERGDNIAHLIFLQRCKREKEYRNCDNKKKEKKHTT